jgi:hypothetical protein
MAKALRDYDRLSIVEKRISYLVGARLRNKDKIGQAMRKQDEIRECHPASKGWDSVSMIRKWREAR